jgi:hypothetical protein
MVRNRRIDALSDPGRVLSSNVGGVLFLGLQITRLSCGLGRSSGASMARLHPFNARCFRECGKGFWLRVLIRFGGRFFARR